MPVQFSQNVRIPPSNVRNVDVAVSTLNRLIPAQVQKYDAAFRVQGFNGILYHRLHHGESCACKSKLKKLKALLDRDGNAEPGLINELLTGGTEFGYRRYGTHVAPVPSSETNTVLEVRLPGNPYPLPSLYDTDTGTPERGHGTFDRYGTSADDPAASTIVPDGEGPNGPVKNTEEIEDLIEGSGFDIGLLPNSDVSCPICFGSGYVGGYSIYNGYRKVLVPQSSEEFTGTLEMNADVPYANTTRLLWKVLLPRGVVSVDSLRLFNEDQVVGIGTESTLRIDSVAILSPNALLQFCDGAYHLVELVFEESTDVTHLEIQLNQSEEFACFEFPKVSKSSTQSLLESSDPFQIVLSPRIPKLSVLDVFVDSTYSKRLQIKSVTGWNDRQRAVLGWEAEVRVTQPQELFHLLPGRPLRAPVASL
jgi:hypothetical protein